MANEPDWPAAASKAKADVYAAIDELRDLLRRYDPMEITSRVAIYIISGHPDMPKEDGPDKNEAHLEYLISLATAFPFPHHPVFPTPSVIQNVIQLLTKIHIGASIHHMLGRRSQTDKKSALEEMTDSFRRDKLHVRGDAYWPHLRQTMVALLHPHDQKLQEVLGFTSDEFFRLMERTETEMQDRLTQEITTHTLPYLNLMRPWRGEMRTSAGDVSKLSERFRDFLRQNEAAIIAAKEKFDAFGTPSAFIATAETPQEEKILASLSCKFGENTDFHGIKPEHAFWPLTDSLTDRKPIIKRNGTCYAFHMPKVLRGAFKLVGDLLKQQAPDYWKHNFLRARDIYLEQETASLFRKALPHAQVADSVEYDVKADNKRAEADIVIACDDFLIIVECKAGGIAPATRRGGEKSVKSDLAETIVGGLNQAERLVSELTSQGTLRLRPRNGGPDVILQAGSFRWLVRANVTLEMMSAVATSLWTLDGAGMVQNPERCWSVALNDLRVIVEILDEPALFLHYLIRRLDLNEIRSIMAKDELDFMMRYVEHGLFFREANEPKANETIMLTGYTEKLDQYYRRVQGLTNLGKKPKVSLGKRTKRILGLLQASRPGHWVTGSLELLEFDLPVREDLVGKLPGQLKLLQQKSAAYAFSIVANLQTRRGLALASSKQPEKAIELIKGRCIDHCRKESLDEIWIILLGVPVGVAPMFVFCATADGEVSDQTSRLLQQLRYEITEHRRTGTGSAEQLESNGLAGDRSVSPSGQ